MPDIIFAKPEEFLTSGKAAYELKLAPGTLQNMRSQGLGPKFTKHRGRVYYHIEDIRAYKQKHFRKYRSTSEWKEEYYNKADV